VAESLPLVDVAALEAGALEVVAIVCAQVRLGSVIAEQVGEHHEDAMCYRQDRLLLAPAASEPMALSGEVVARRMGAGPGDLAPDGPQPPVAMRRMFTQALATALLVSGADPCPGGEVSGRAEATHLGPDLERRWRWPRTPPLREASARGRRRQRKGSGPARRGRQLLQLPVKEVEKGQDMAQQHPVLGGHAPRQRLAQRGPFRS
jgi:hypothetical protein